MSRGGSPHAIPSPGSSGSRAMAWERLRHGVPIIPRSRPPSLAGSGSISLSSRTLSLSHREVQVQVVSSQVCTRNEDTPSCMSGSREESGICLMQFHQIVHQILPPALPLPRCVGCADPPVLLPAPAAGGSRPLPGRPVGAGAGARCRAPRRRPAIPQFPERGELAGPSIGCDKAQDHRVAGPTRRSVPWKHLL